MLSRHARTAVLCTLLVAAMGGLAYAAVPLYRLFCQVTGFAGTTQRATRPSAIILERTVTVRFDANVASGLNWEFQPVVPTMEVRIGENNLAFYKVTNRSSRPMVGTATFNVAPDQLGIYFIKLECFCFKEQRLEPGESMEMPVSFYVDPRFDTDRDVRHITHLTLSYTFHPVEAPQSAPRQGS